MKHLLPEITVRRSEPLQNINRYYSMSVQPNLFGGYSLVRSWGRIGISCRTRVDLVSTQSEAEDCLLRLLRQKKRRGYH